MIAYDKQGTVFALREGAELLVHDGPSEGPLWRKMLDGTIVGLGADSEHVAAITSAGMLTWFGAKSGDLIETAKVDGTVERAVFHKATTCVAVTASAIVAIDRAGTTTLAEHGANAIAVRPDGGVCAAHGGELVQIIAGKRSTCVFEQTVRAIAWHPAGFWLVGAQNKIERWDGSGTPSHVTQIPDATRIDHLATTDKAVAMSWDDHHVAEMSWPAKDTLGDLFYPERKVEGLDFGPWPYLGVSLDLGDANKLDADNPQQLARSDTHPGRVHHSWIVRVGAAGAGDEESDGDDVGDDDDDSKGDDKSTAAASHEELPRKDNPGQALLGLLLIGGLGVLVYFLVG